MKYSLNDLVGKRVHLVGVGGSGMSGLARIMASDGITVTGSDVKESSVLSGLRAIGASITRGHRAENVYGADYLVFSSAISPDNPELIQATKLNIPQLSRAAALAILMSSSKSIAIAGTHGKTTTTSMLTVAMQSCGEDPSFAIGGTLTTSGSNAHRGTGDFFIAEADAWRPEAWEIIKATPHLQYQILTKRPERILQCLPPDWGEGYANVWLGISVEDQAAMELRMPIFIEVEAKLLQHHQVAF